MIKINILDILNKLPSNTLSTIGKAVYVYTSSYIEVQSKTLSNVNYLVASAPLSAGFFTVISPNYNHNLFRLPTLVSILIETVLLSIFS
jgi:hypothetical protein